MAFWIEITDRDQKYLDEGAGLTPKAVDALWDFVAYGLEEMTDSFRLDPANRVGHESYHFKVQFILRDGAAEGAPLRAFDFYLNDEKTELGVLRVMYVEEVTPGR